MGQRGLTWEGTAADGLCLNISVSQNVFIFNTSSQLEFLISSPCLFYRRKWLRLSAAPPSLPKRCLSAGEGCRRTSHSPGAVSVSWAQPGGKSLILERLFKDRRFFWLGMVKFSPWPYIRIVFITVLNC